MLNKRHARSDERGQVIVVFAILIPVLFAMGAVVMDIGNWYIHKRHLQTQVDAAALAGGPQFVGCFHDPAAANAAIASRALAYAGDTARLGQTAPNAPASTTNRQLGQPDDVRVVLNANRYWDKPDGLIPGGNGYGLDHTLDSGDPDTLGDPCNEKFLDVKATDDDAPPLWGLIPLTPSPKTHARVQINDAEFVSGLLPWAVPEIDPKAVVALFVDEDPGSTPVVFDHQRLTLADDPGLPWSEWTTPVGQEDVTLDGGHENTGVVLLVSKNDPTPNISTSLTTTCNQAPALIACYGSGVTQTSGLSFIHGYNGGSAGTLQTPIVREVELVASGCTAADLSAPYFTLDGGAGCTATVQAIVDFGVTGNPQTFPNCVTVNSSPGGAMAWAGNAANGSRFTASFNLASLSGRNVVNLSWESERRPGRTNCNQTRWSGNFNKVAAPYVSDDLSGPIQYLDLLAFKADGTTLMPDANSVELNDPGNPNYKYFVTVGLPKPHAITNYTDPPVLLRMASPSGSQNQAWDCDSGRNFREEIETGCRTVYRENYRDLDGDGDKEWNNILCTGWGTGNLPPPTVGPGPPPYPSDCVITQTGDSTGQLRDGLHARFETPCVDNNWPDNATEASIFFGPNGGGYGTDPRYVTLIITDDTAFTGSGNDPLPIKYFAGFYVTGWDFHNTQSPGCPDPDGVGPRKGNDCHPIYGCSYGQSLDNGDVWGYFVDIVLFTNQGEPDDELCDFGADPAACVVNLVE